VSDRVAYTLEDHIKRWNALDSKAVKKRRSVKAARSESVASSPTAKELLAEMLETAIALEFATIPPYLCALWSIHDDLHPVAKSLREIVQEEMLHMGLACNMLAAIEGQPPIRELAPEYDSRPLPGGVHPGLKIQLQGLNKQSLLAFLQIESPAKLARSVPKEKGDPQWPSNKTIGQFYECLLAAFEKYVDEGGTFHLANQVSASLVWRVISSVDDVKTAIGIITTQGEGATGSKGPGSSPRDSGRNDYAHYYRFLEMWKEKRLVRLDSRNARTERYEWQAGYELPSCRPMGPVPEKGFSSAPQKVEQLLADFVRTYHSMLGLLESTWRAGGQGDLVKAISKMFELERYAKPLMEIPREDNPAMTYGPVFATPPKKEQPEIPIT